MNQNKGDDWARRGLNIGGIILIGIGGLFLTINMGWMPFISDSWPVILIVVGISLIIGGFKKPQKKGDEPIP